MNNHIARCTIALAILIGLVVPAYAQRRPITDKDLFAFVWVADPQISPDGSQVAFVKVTVDEKKDAYDTAIWLAKADGSEPPRAITGGTRDTSPRWSPDGRRLAFLRSVEKDGRPQPAQVHVMAMVSGGEPWAITEIPRGAANPEWAPDGKTIAFSSTARPTDLTAAQKPAADKPRETDVRVITEAVYRANGVPGGGYVDRDRPAQIWTVPVPATASEKATPVAVTSGEFAAANHRWSRDGTRIFFVADRRRESYYYARDSDLYSIARDGGEPARVASIEGSIGAYALSPDGTRVAFVGTLVGNPERSYTQPDLWVAEVGSGTPRNLTAGYDFDINGGIGGDQRAPRGQLPSGPVWTRDGRTILVGAGEQGNANLKRVDAATGKIDSLTTGNHDVMSYTGDAGGQRFAFVLSKPTAVGDLHILDASAPAAPKQLTTFNDALFGQLTMNEAEELWYTSFDGRKIQGWILKPPAFEATRKYPLILQIHGGPHSAYGNTFTHEFQSMAGAGYVVLYTNPRGSSNYGQDFGNSIQYNYPGDDYKDLMAGVDEILKKGYIDETRLAVTGGSGGGLLTNWVVTQTNRFKAAVSQRDISDWANFWYTADFTLFTPTWFRKAPFEDPADFAKRSPITHVAKIETPLMFILGDEDWRTPPAAGGEDLFRALKYLKRPTVMVRFPGESHELSRSGRPWHRVERLQHIVGWFDKWVMGKENATYDAPSARPAAAAAPAPSPRDPGPPTRANILRGEYGRYRANNDLLSYHLDVRVDPDKKFLSGKNAIRFKMLQDDTRIQLDLYDNLKVEKILLGTPELKYERELNAVFIDFPDTLKRGREYTIDFHYSGSPRETGRFGGIAFRKDPAGRHWINTACEGEGSSIWWPSKDQWRDEVENMRLSVSIPNGLVDVSNGRFLGKTDLGDGYTRWDWQIHYPINSYNVSLNIGALRAVLGSPGRPDARLLRAAREPREGQGAVRAGQADDRGLSEVLRRVSVQEGRLQADRGALLGHGAPERRDLRQPLRQRLPRARLDRRRRQPEVRLHHHPRERARVVRQQRVGRRRLRHVDSGGLDDLPRGRLRRAHVRLRRRAEVRQRLQVEGQEPGADHHAARHPPHAVAGPVLQGRALPAHAAHRRQRRQGVVEADARHVSAVQVPEHHDRGHGPVLQRGDRQELDADLRPVPAARRPPDARAHVRARPTARSRIAGRRTRRTSRCRSASARPAPGRRFSRRPSGRR